MAGAILIGDKNGVSMGSHFFVPIIERTREEFRPEEKAFIEHIYRPYDHDGMSFIVLEGVSKAAFLSFCQAAETAYKKHREDTGSNCPEFAWLELFEKLKQDPRHEP